MVWVHSEKVKVDLKLGIRGKSGSAAITLLSLGQNMANPFGTWKKPAAALSRTVIEMTGITACKAPHQRSTDEKQMDNNHRNEK